MACCQRFIENNKYTIEQITGFYADAELEEAQMLLELIQRHEIGEDLDILKCGKNLNSNKKRLLSHPCVIRNDILLETG